MKSPSTVGSRFRSAIVFALLAGLGATFGPSRLAAQQDTADDPALQLYFAANGAYNRKLYPAAVNGYEQFLRTHPNHPKANLARRGLALSLYAQGRYDEAIPQLGALLANGQLDKKIERDRLVILHGQCLLRTDRKDEAREFFVREHGRLENAQYRTSALAVICDVSFGRSEWEEVRKWTASLLKSNVTADQAARGLYQQGFANYRLQRYAEASKCLRQVASLEAGPAWKTRAAYLLGECLSLEGDHEKAESAFLAALPGLQGDDKAECQRRLGVAQFLLKKWDAAAIQFEAYLASKKAGAPADDPLVAEARLYLGRCAHEAGELEKSARILQPLLRADGATGAQANLWHARNLVGKSEPDYDRAAEVLANALQRYGRTPVIDDLRFDYANALMSSRNPDWKRAADTLVQINAKTFAQVADVLAQRATCHHKLGEFAKSKTLASDYLRRFPDHHLAADVAFLNAENYFLLNELDAASQAYRRFLTSHPDHSNKSWAVLRVAQIAHHQSRWEEAIATAEPLLGEKPEGRILAQLSFVVGDSYCRQEQWKDAVPPLEAFVAATSGREPDSPPDHTRDTALLQLAIAHERLGNSADALRHLETLTEPTRSPTSYLPRALADLGRLAYQTKKLELARQSLERFLDGDRRKTAPFRQGAAEYRPAVHYYLGWVEATESHHHAAARHFAEAARDPRHPLAPDAALQEGLAYVQAEDFGQAAKHFTDILRRYPQHEELPRVTFYAGLALAREERWREAPRYLRKVTESWPDSEFADQALYEWAWCERKQERDQEAVKLYERLLQQHPGSLLAVKVQSELAELNLASGAQDMVIARLTKTLQEVKDDKAREDLRYQLASAHYRQSEFEVAATQFEQLLADYPDSERRASMHFQAGEARLKLKETVAARDHFAAGMQVQGLEDLLVEPMLMRLAEMQSATGDHASSRKTYAEFLERFSESQWRRNAQFGLAWSMENSGDSESAIEAYAKLLAPDAPVDLWTVRARFQTGECHFNLQQYDKAIAQFVDVEVNYKKFPAWQSKSLLEIARVHLAQNNRDEAMQRFKDVLTRYPKEKAAVVAGQYLDQLRSQ